MTIHIPISDLEPNIRTLYLENNIFELSLDYQTNAITGYFKNKGIYEEVELFNFSKVCKMDNRWTGYELHQSTFEITIQITGLNK